MKMPNSELVIVYPSAGEIVAHDFIVRGTVADSGVSVKVWLETDGGAPIPGDVTGPLPNPDGGDWFATFDPHKVGSGDYQLVAAIETRANIHVLQAAKPLGGVSICSLRISIPFPGGTVSNPITVCGAVSPAGYTVTCSITSGGKQYPGVVTGPCKNGNWCTTFPESVPSGSATINLNAKSNGNSCTASQNITVK